jgi:hypothetical protein
MAIPIARESIEAIHLLALSVLIALIASIIVGVVVLAFGEPLLTALGVAPLAPFLWLLPIALFVASIAQAVGSWAVYHRSFPALGRMRAMQGLAQAGCQALFGLANLGPAGLTTGRASSSVGVLSIIVGLAYSWRRRRALKSP